MTKGKIKPRGDSFQVDYVDSFGRRHRPTFKTVTEANTRLALLRATDEAGERSGGAGLLTLRDALNFTVRGRWAHSRAKRSAMSNAQDALDYIGEDTLLTAITKDTLKAYKTELKLRLLTDATINRKLSALTVMLDEACEAGAIPFVPKIRRQKERLKRFRWLSKEEVITFHKLIDYNSAGLDSEAADLFMFLIDTGLRVQVEALRLTTGDVAGNKLFIRHGKGAKARTILLTKRAQDVISRRAANANASMTDRLWSLDYSKFRTRFDAVRYQLDWAEDVTIHTLRHTCASWMAQKGVPLQVIKEWMGHTSIQTTMRYAHLATQHLSVAMEAMEDSTGE